MYYSKFSAISVILIAMLGAAYTGGCVSRDLAAPASAAKAEPTPGDAVVTIAAVGDIMLGSTSINDSFLPPRDGRDLLKEVTPILSAADIAFGNLEGPMLEGGKSEKCADTSAKKDTGAYATPTPTPTPAPAKPGAAKKPAVCFAFRVPTRYGKYLKDAGFDILSLANNHASDFGEYGRISTRKVLDDLGTKYA